MNQVLDLATQNSIASALLELALRSIPILSAACIITALMRSSSAAARHLVWCLALGAVMLLPLLALLPAWRIVPEMPPMLSGTLTATALEPPAGIHNAPPPPAGAELPAAAHAGPVLILVIWAIGAGAVLLPMIVGRIMLLRIERTGEHAAPQMAALLESTRASVGIRSPVRLVQHETAPGPMTWGTLRPTIAIPPAAVNWPPERQRSVLLHELAHIARWDCLTHAGARVLCAVLWFNPFVWIALWRLRVERERACDDIVLTLGARGPEYAHDLLAVAAAGRRPLCAAAALPMARMPALERRVRHILDTGRNRRPLGSLNAAGIAGLLLLLAVAAGCVDRTLARSSDQQAEAVPDLPRNTRVWNEETEHASREARMLALYCWAHAMETDSRLPADIGVLAGQLLRDDDFEDDAARARFLLMPQDEQRIPVPQQFTPEWARQNASYIYLGDDRVVLTNIDQPESGRTVLFHTPLDRPFLVAQPDGTQLRLVVLGMYDSHGEARTVEKAREMIEASRKRLAAARAPR